MKAQSGTHHHWSDGFFQNSSITARIQTRSKLLIKLVVTVASFNNFHQMPLVKKQLVGMDTNQTTITTSNCLLIKVNHFWWSNSSQACFKDKGFRNVIKLLTQSKTRRRESGD
jgi:hypothetical protein